jgi:hypothetical protein
MTMVVGIYNSAGEQVKQLFSGPSQDSPQGFALDASSIVAMGGGVNLSFGGALSGLGNTLTWVGDNNSGQAVGGGTYYVKAEMTDAFGATQAWSQAVNVLPQAAAQSLKIYNSAGELVATLDATSFSGQTLTRLGFSKGDSAAYALGSGGGVDFVLQDSGGNQVSTHWDGKSSSGATVKPGSYTVQLIDNNDGKVILVSKGFVLLADPAASSFSVVAGPNPVGPATKQVVFAMKGLKSGEHAVLRLYNLGGELISQGSDSAGSGKIVLNIGNWSSGVYVAVVECRDGGAVVSRKLIRMAVQR